MDDGDTTVNGNNGKVSDNQVGIHNDVIISEFTDDSSLKFFLPRIRLKCIRNALNENSVSSRPDSPRQAESSLPDLVSSRSSTEKDGHNKKEQNGMSPQEKPSRKSNGIDGRGENCFVTNALSEKEENTKGGDKKSHSPASTRDHSQVRDSSRTASDFKAPEHADDKPAVTLKRGRGRPRKDPKLPYILPTPLATVVKKKRGRPRKDSEIRKTQIKKTVVHNYPLRRPHLSTSRRVNYSKERFHKRRRVLKICKTRVPTVQSEILDCKTIGATNISRSIACNLPTNDVLSRVTREQRTVPEQKNEETGNLPCGLSGGVPSSVDQGMQKTNSSVKDDSSSVLTGKAVSTESKDADLLNLVQKAEAGTTSNISSEETEVVKRKVISKHSSKKSPRVNNKSGDSLSEADDTHEVDSILDTSNSSNVRHLKLPLSIRELPKRKRGRPRKKINQQSLRKNSSHAKSNSNVTPTKMKRRGRPPNPKSRSTFGSKQPDLSCQKNQQVNGDCNHNFNSPECHVETDKEILAEGSPMVLPDIQEHQDKLCLLPIPQRCTVNTDKNCSPFCVTKMVDPAQHNEGFSTLATVSSVLEKDESEKLSSVLASSEWKDKSSLPTPVDSTRLVCLTPPGSNDCLSTSGDDCLQMLEEPSSQSVSEDVQSNTEPMSSSDTIKCTESICTKGCSTDEGPVTFSSLDTPLLPQEVNQREGDCEDDDDVTLRSTEDQQVGDDNKISKAHERNEDEVNEPVPDGSVVTPTDESVPDSDGLSNIRIVKTVTLSRIGAPYSVSSEVSSSDTVLNPVNTESTSSIPRQERKNIFQAFGAAFSNMSATDDTGISQEFQHGSQSQEAYLLIEDSEIPHLEAYGGIHEQDSSLHSPHSGNSDCLPILEKEAFHDTWLDDEDEFEFENPSDDDQDLPSEDDKDLDKQPEKPVSEKPVASDSAMDWMITERVQSVSNFASNTEQKEDVMQEHEPICEQNSQKDAQTEAVNLEQDEDEFEFETPEDGDTLFGSDLTTNGSLHEGGMHDVSLPLEQSEIKELNSSENTAEPAQTAADTHKRIQPDLPSFDQQQGHCDPVLSLSSNNVEVPSDMGLSASVENPNSTRETECTVSNGDEALTETTSQEANNLGGSHVVTTSSSLIDSFCELECNVASAVNHEATGVNNRGPSEADSKPKESNKALLDKLVDSMGQVDDQAQATYRFSQEFASIESSVQKIGMDQLIVNSDPGIVKVTNFVTSKDHQEPAGDGNKRERFPITVNMLNEKIITEGEEADVSTSLVVSLSPDPSSQISKEKLATSAQPSSVFQSKQSGTHNEELEENMSLGQKADNHQVHKIAETYDQKSDVKSKEVDEDEANFGSAESSMVEKMIVQDANHGSQDDVTCNEEPKLVVAGDCLVNDSQQDMEKELGEDTHDSSTKCSITKEMEMQETTRESEHKESTATSEAIVNCDSALAISREVQIFKELITNKTQEPQELESNPNTSKTKITSVNMDMPPSSVEIPDNAPLETKNKLPVHNLVDAQGTVQTDPDTSEAEIAMANKDLPSKTKRKDDEHMGPKHADEEHDIPNSSNEAQIAPEPEIHAKPLQHSVQCGDQTSGRNQDHVHDDELESPELGIHRDDELDLGDQKTKKKHQLHTQHCVAESLVLGSCDTTSDPKHADTIPEKTSMLQNEKVVESGNDSIISTGLSGDAHMQQSVSASDEENLRLSSVSTETAGSPKDQEQSEDLNLGESQFEEAVELSSFALEDTVGGYDEDAMSIASSGDATVPYPRSDAEDLNAEIEQLESNTLEESEEVSASQCVNKLQTSETTDEHSLHKRMRPTTSCKWSVKFTKRKRRKRNVDPYSIWTKKKSRKRKRKSMDTDMVVNKSFEISTTAESKLLQVANKGDDVSTALSTSTTYEQVINLPETESCEKDVEVKSAVERDSNKTQLVQNADGETSGDNHEENQSSARAQELMDMDDTDISNTIEVSSLPDVQLPEMHEKSDEGIIGKTDEPDVPPEARSGRESHRSRDEDVSHADRESVADVVTVIDISSTSSAAISNEDDLSRDDVNQPRVESMNEKAQKVAAADTLVRLATATIIPVATLGPGNAETFGSNIRKKRHQDKATFFGTMKHKNSQTRHKPHLSYPARGFPEQQFPLHPRHQVPGLRPTYAPINEKEDDTCHELRQHLLKKKQLPIPDDDKRNIYYHSQERLQTENQILQPYSAPAKGKQSAESPRLEDQERHLALRNPGAMQLQHQYEEQFSAMRGQNFHVDSMRPHFQQCFSKSHSTRLLYGIQHEKSNPGYHKTHSHFGQRTAGNVLLSSSAVFTAGTVNPSAANSIPVNVRNLEVPVQIFHQEENSVIPTHDKKGLPLQHSHNQKGYTTDVPVYTTSGPKEQLIAVYPDRFVPVTQQDAAAHLVHVDKAESFARSSPANKMSLPFTNHQVETSDRDTLLNMLRQLHRMPVYAEQESHHLGQELSSAEQKQMDPQHPRQSPRLGHSFLSSQTFAPAEVQPLCYSQRFLPTGMKPEYATRLQGTESYEQHLTPLEILQRKLQNPLAGTVIEAESTNQVSRTSKSASPHLTDDIREHFQRPATITDNFGKMSNLSRTPTPKGNGTPYARPCLVSTEAMSCELPTSSELQPSRSSTPRSHSSTSSNLHHICTQSRSSDDCIIDLTGEERPLDLTCKGRRTQNVFQEHLGDPLDLSHKPTKNTIEDKSFLLVNSSHSIREFDAPICHVPDPGSRMLIETGAHSVVRIRPANFTEDGNVGHRAAHTARQGLGTNTDLQAYDLTLPSKASQFIYDRPVVEIQPDHYIANDSGQCNAEHLVSQRKRGIDVYIEKARDPSTFQELMRNGWTSEGPGLQISKTLNSENQGLYSRVSSGNEAPTSKHCAVIELKRDPKMSAAHLAELQEKTKLSSTPDCPSHQQDFNQSSSLVMESPSRHAPENPLEFNPSSEDHSRTRNEQISGGAASQDCVSQSSKENSMDIQPTRTSNATRSEDGHSRQEKLQKTVNSAINVSVNSEVQHKNNSETSKDLKHRHSALSDMSHCPKKRYKLAHEAAQRSTTSYNPSSQSVHPAVFNTKETKQPESIPSPPIHRKRGRPKGSRKAGNEKPQVEETVTRQCTFCEFQTKSRQELMQHVKETHFKKHRTKSSSHKDTSDAEIEIGQNIVVRNTRRPASSMNVDGSDESTPKKGDDSDVEGFAINNAKTSGSDKCQHCSLQFPDTPSLVAHQRTAHPEEENTFACKLCGHTEDKAGPLVVHINKNHHRELKSGPCPFLNCSRIFSTSKELRDHLNDHWIVKQYACKICGIRYQVLNSLKAHLDRHKQELPNLCKVCNLSFKTRGTLLRHQKQRGHVPPKSMNDPS